jgi:hypothetical protein
MKRLLLFVIILTVFSCFITIKTDAQDNNQQNKQLNRILIINFKPGTIADSIKLVDNAYLEISKLPGIKSFKIGVKKANVKEPLSITHLYLLGFQTEQDVANYMNSPQHGELIKLIKIVRDYQIIDYWTEN